MMIDWRGCAVLVFLAGICFLAVYGAVELLT